MTDEPIPPPAPTLQEERDRYREQRQERTIAVLREDLNKALGRIEELERVVKPFCVFLKEASTSVRDK